jgi:hypothetical protein
LSNVCCGVGPKSLSGVAKASEAEGLPARFSPPTTHDLFFADQKQRPRRRWTIGRRTEGTLHTSLYPFRYSECRIVERGLQEGLVSIDGSVRPIHSAAQVAMVTRGCLLCAIVPTSATVPLGGDGNVDAVQAIKSISTRLIRSPERRINALTTL